MSIDHSFTSAPVRQPSLQIFLRQEHSRFIAEPGRLLQPLIHLLDSIHLAGKAHGAVMPSCILVSPSGEIDLEFFKARAGSPEQVEASTYYPDGYGDSAESSQRRDLQALGAVMHLIVADQPPASPARRVQRLAEQPAAKDWPTGFIEMVDRLLDPGVASILPTLQEFSSTLDPVAPITNIADAAVAPEAETSVNPVTGPINLESGAVAMPVVEVEKLPVPLAPRPPEVRLPNAMVGRGFSAEIVSTFAGDLQILGRIELLSDVPPGLEFKDGLLAGKPEVAGEFEIHFRFHPSQPEMNRPNSLERILSLTINPDPRSLWRNTPSDQSDQFWKSDSAIDFLVDGPLSVLGASLRGRSHAHVGSFRDDDMAMVWIPASSWYSLTVADGAGSARFSRQGSKIACEVVKSQIADYFSGEENRMSQLLTEQGNNSDFLPSVWNELYHLFGKTALQARKAIEDQALSIQATSRDFHTTLITALLHPLGDGRWFVATFSIGDGAAAIVSAPGGDPCLLTRPDGGDYAGQTVFLTMSEALATGESIMGRIQMAIIPEFDALILVTDGISDPRFDSEAALADPIAWSALWRDLKLAMPTADSPKAAAEAVLNWMEFHSPGHHDDRTLILASRSPIISKS
jgi:serine/threonine protein phosphatase PrpC